MSPNADRPTLMIVVGARPNFIKVAPLVRAFRDRIDIDLVHTGQHYDWEMSKIFFDQLGIPEPSHHLGVGSAPAAEQVARITIGVAEVLKKSSPVAVMVLGDTNSCLGGALAARKSDFRLAHLESGLRSFNRAMPEEINRVLIDRMADWLFCPCRNAVRNLKKEGLTEGVHLVGDVMVDAVLGLLPRARMESRLGVELGLKAVSYVLATIHRRENVDDRERLEGILDGLSGSPLPVVLPLHPRTREAVDSFGLGSYMREPVRAIDPVGYFDLLSLMSLAAVVATDSGGLQKEAFTLGVPCVTFREETEWVETVQAGWNLLVSVDPGVIRKALGDFRPTGRRPRPYGNGVASPKVVEVMLDLLSG